MEGDNRYNRYQKYSFLLNNIFSVVNFKVLLPLFLLHLIRMRGVEAIRRSFGSLIDITPFPLLLTLL